MGHDRVLLRGLRDRISTSEERTVGNLIVAFPKLENAKSIRSILIRGGFSVSAVCTSGAHALQYANELGDGILVCASQLRDVTYRELYQDLPPYFAMLLLTTQHGCSQMEDSGIVCLSMPLKVPELLRTVEEMEDAAAWEKKRRRGKIKQRSDREREIVQEAKELLMARKGMAEEEAYRYIQKNSMDSGVGMTETARKLLTIMK